MTAKRALLVLVAGVALFAGSYGVGRAGEADPEPLPALAKPTTAVPAIGTLGEARPLPGMARRPRRKRAPAPSPAPAPAAQAPEPQTAQPVQRAPTPTPTPAPSPRPAPTPAPSPGGGFDDSG